LCNDDNRHGAPYTQARFAIDDKSADPWCDFYQYTVGWMKNNPIPQTRRVERLRQAHVDNQRFSLGILDELAKKTTGATQPNRRLATIFRLHE